MGDKKINILVTGVGAIIGYGILNSLRNCSYDCNLVGIDIYDDAVGQVWCDSFVKGVKANSPDFIEFINRLVSKYSIDLVIPGIEQDLESLLKNFSQLNKKAKYVLNNKDVFDIFHNKKMTYEFLQNKVSLIPHLYYSENLFLESLDRLGLPFVLKKNVSYASKGVAIIENKQDFDYFLQKFGKDCMTQKKLPIKNNEITCSIFGTGDGDFVNPICLKRELSGEGATSKASNIEIEPELMNTLKTICKLSKFEGPTNLQFIRYQEKYYLLEVNARISSSTSIRQIFGVNEAEMCIDFYLFNKTPAFQEQRHGTVSRYIKDQYFDSDNF